MKQIVIKIQGGLGNQVFQYLFGLSLSSLENTEVWFDISEYIHKKGIRNFALNKLNLSGNFLSCESKIEISNCSITLKNIKKHYTSTSLNTRNIRNIPYIKESDIKNNYNINNLKSGYYEGYWISYLYWNNPEQLIKKVNEKLDFVTNFSNLEKLIDFKSIDKYCAVHVRRGDYLSPEHINWHGICSNQYYTESISAIPHEKVYFFSDDMDYIENNFNKASEFINASKLINSEVDEFLLLRKFRNLILSNSTYSYLAALLSSFDFQQSEVIVPYPWYKWADLHPPLLAQWNRRNNINGVSELEDLYTIQNSKVGIAIEYTSNVLLENQLDDLINQTILPCHVFIIDNKLISENDLHKLTIKYNIFQISSVTNLNQVISIFENNEKNTFDYLCIFRNHEKWLSNKILKDLKACIELKADIAISSVCSIDKSNNSLNHKKIYEEITNSSILDDRLIRNVLAEYPSVFFNKNALIFDINNKNTKNLKINSLSNLYYQIGLSKSRKAIQNDHTTFCSREDFCTEDIVQKIIKYQLTFSNLLEDRRSNLTIQFQFYKFIKNIIELEYFKINDSSNNIINTQNTIRFNPYYFIKSFIKKTFNKTRNIFTFIKND